MKMKIICIIFAAVFSLLSVTGCGSKCENGCGNAADPNCMAGMCDECCSYWLGLNGCYNDEHLMQ